MLGYTTPQAARAMGFTHHGKYFGIPVYLAYEDDDGLVVATKWAPLGYVMSLFHHIEAFLQGAFFPDREPGFVFLVGPKIVI